MSESSRSIQDQSVDLDNKLVQYMQINKQISKTLTSQRIEIAKLKKLLNNSASEIINLQLECHKWKKKFLAIRDMYFTHIQTIASDLQTNADKINSISAEYNDPDDVKTSCQPLDQRETSQTNNSNPSRRVSKNFEPQKNRSDRSQEETIELHTIDEESEEMEQSSLEVTAERKNDSNGVVDERKADESKADDSTSDESRTDDSNTDSNGSNNESSKTNDSKDEEAADGNSQANVEESLESGEESRSNLDETEPDESQSDESERNEESDESYRDASEQGSDEENDEQSNEDSDERDDESDNESEADESTLVENEIEEQNENEDASDAGSKGDSVEQVSLLTTNCESTIKNDDSNKKNETVDASISTRSVSDTVSQSVISVDGPSVLQSTSVKSFSKLPASKKTINNRSVEKSQDESLEVKTFGRLNAKTLVSSTPYRNAPNDIGGASTSVLTRARSKTSNTTVSLSTQVTISNGEAHVSTLSSSSRPKRKAAPVILSEPKLNTKLRRPCE